jgi:AcrR family transcriptional regulator
MSAQKIDTEIRQEQIAQATLDIIGSHGIRALSIAAIASRIGIVPSAIYRHFPSKADVLNAALDLVRERLLSNVTLVREEKTDALDRLQTILMRHSRLLQENQAIPHIVFSESIFSDSIERKAKVKSIITGYLKRIEKIVREGQQAGQIRKEIDPITVAMTFMGIILPGAILRKVTDGVFDLTLHVERAWKIFRRGISEIR